MYAICDEIISRKLKLNWACETRVDMLDYEMAADDVHIGTYVELKKGWTRVPEKAGP